MGSNSLTFIYKWPFYEPDIMGGRPIRPGSLWCGSTSLDCDLQKITENLGEEKQIGYRDTEKEETAQSKTSIYFPHANFLVECVLK